MKRAYIVAVLIAILGATTGCSARAEPIVDDSANQVEVDADDSGGQVELEVGQILVITLETNPTTGYGWHVAELDESVLRQQEGSPLYHPLGSEDLDGAGGLGIFRFEAVDVGQTKLELVYSRPWEDEEPFDVFSLQVVVR